MDRSVRTAYELTIRPDVPDPHFNPRGKLFVIDDGIKCYIDLNISFMCSADKIGKHLRLDTLGIDPHIESAQTKVHSISTIIHCCGKRYLISDWY